MESMHPLGFEITATRFKWNDGQTDTDLGVASITPTN